MRKSNSYSAMSRVSNSRASSANTPEAPPAPPVEGAEVQEGGGKKRRGRAARPAYPNIPETGLVGWPSDYNPATHARLKPTDFADEVVYWHGRAAELTRMAQQATEQANTLAALGSVKDREAASKALRLMQQLETIKQQMAESGVDPEVITNLMAQAKRNAESGSAA